MSSHAELSLHKLETPLAQCMGPMLEHSLNKVGAWSVKESEVGT